MLKAYKYRIYPTKEQEVLIQKNFGCVRFMYNRLLADSQEEYKVNGKEKIFTPAKYKEEFQWLKEVDSMALCNAQMNVKTSFSNFFRKLKQGKKVRGLGFLSSILNIQGKGVIPPIALTTLLELKTRS